MQNPRTYYGGQSLPQLADVIRSLNARGMRACVSILPRLRYFRSGVRAEKEKYLSLLSGLSGLGLRADVTVKLSQLGEHWVFGDCVEALGEIVEDCGRRGAFLWVDMEQSYLVDQTIVAFESVARDHDNVGLCLQTYLKRTPRDLDHLMREGWPVRLVKGYYRERPPVCFDTWQEVTECFARLIPTLLEKSRRPAIGTHDAWLIEQAKRALARVPQTAAAAAPPGPGPAPLEFQMFLGAKPRLAEGLAKEGYPIRIYIPYGALLPYVLHSLPYMDISRNLQRVLGIEKIR